MKFPYFADTIEREDKGCEDRVTLWRTLMATIKYALERRSTIFKTDLVQHIGTQQNSRLCKCSLALMPTLQMNLLQKEELQTT